MGRVVPKNTEKNLLTRLLDLERSGGYQVDQQARHNMMLVPQYGGTVGGFRKSIVDSFGGFDTRVLAEDTDLTFLLYTRGWKVSYANRVECYEESPENWISRSTQIFRWSRGHNHVLFKHFFAVIRSPYLRFAEKFDGLLLLCLYLIPFFILSGMIDSMILFFLGEMQIIESIFVFFFVAGYRGNTYGYGAAASGCESDSKQRTPNHRGSTRLRRRRPHGIRRRCRASRRCGVRRPQGA